jgi:hypothetical protein
MTRRIAMASSVEVISDSPGCPVWEQKILRKSRQKSFHHVISNHIGILG